MTAPLRTLADEPIQLTATPGVVSLFWVENVAIMSWRGHATPALVEELGELWKSQRARFPKGMSFVHVGRAQYVLMDSQTRDVFVRVTRELDGCVVGIGFVTHASGFMASTLRSVVTGVLVLSRALREIHIHERSEELLSWLPSKHARATGVTLDEAQLLRVLAKAEAVAFAE